jgi:uncharacterized membrane protein YkoI
MKPAPLLTFACVLFAATVYAEQRVAMAALPAAVQATVKEQTKDATLLNISKEKEKGQTVYEVESKVNGKTRDFVVDVAGAVVEVEEEMDLAAVPTAVKAALDKASAGGTLTKVEKTTQGAVVRYEAAITKNGKKSEVTVNGDGTIQKNNN